MRLGWGARIVFFSFRRTGMDVLLAEANPLPTNLSHLVAYSCGTKLHNFKQSRTSWTIAFGCCLKGFKYFWIKTIKSLSKRICAINKSIISFKFDELTIWWTPDLMNSPNLQKRNAWQLFYTIRKMLLTSILAKFICISRFGVYLRIILFREDENNE